MNLKPGRSPGLDGLINEYVIEFKDLILLFVVVQTIFNAMITTGHFSYILCNVLSASIYKKG